MLTDFEKNLIRKHYQNLAHHLPHFRPRIAQRRMMAKIAQVFSQSCSYLPNSDTPPQHDGRNIAVIEGPAGVGKSLAYLVAGCNIAMTRHKKLLVSTATIALQEQLINHDLPLVLAHASLPFTYTLAKGRGRYICPYRLYQLTLKPSQNLLFDGDVTMAVWDKKPALSEIAMLNTLADTFEKRDWDGDIDNWPQTIETRLLSRITNDRYGCLKNTCPNRPECPFFLSRDTLKQADVIVVNHDLLLADSAMGGGVILPPPEETFYCIDEAHHLSKKAIYQFSAEHSFQHATHWLNNLAALSTLTTLFPPCAPVVETIEKIAHAATDDFAAWFTVLEEETTLKPSANNPEAIWLFEDGILPLSLQLPTANLALSLRLIFKQLQTLSATIEQIYAQKKSPQPSLDKMISEVGFLLNYAEKTTLLWQLFNTHYDETKKPIAKWVSRKMHAQDDYWFCAAPIDMAETLTKTLWHRVSAALLTSATLRSLGTFDLLLQQTGLHTLPHLTYFALESPFHFEQQGELCLPPIAANPKNTEAHTQEIIQWLPKLIDTDHAVGTLMLFSSKQQMNAVAKGLTPAMQKIILVQGTLTKARLLVTHQERLRHGPSIIFGMDSFAEGLDLPGTLCVQVIIARLPFSMPNNPIDLTLARWISKQGGDPFMDITVPEASIKLLQAVGRLLRTESDYGRVTILDHRITKQFYGKKLLATLPPFKLVEFLGQEN